MPGQKDLGGPDGGADCGAIPMAMGQKKTDRPSQETVAEPAYMGNAGPRAPAPRSQFPSTHRISRARGRSSWMTWGVVFILGIIGPGIDQVPQQDKLLGAFLLIAFQQLPAEPGGNHGDRTR